MDKKRAKEAAKQVKGSVLEAIGKITGDAKVEAQGAAKKAAGKVTEPVSDVPDTGVKRK